MDYSKSKTMSQLISSLMHEYNIKPAAKLSTHIKDSSDSVYQVKYQ
jgi:hypothetical protein